MTDLTHINGVIWDLDNTLYRFGDDFVDLCNRASAQTAIDMGLQLSFDEAYELAGRSYREHSNSFGAFKKLGMEYTKFHHLFHDRVSFETILVIDDLHKTVESLPHKMVVLTNASRPWAQKILKKTKLDSVFGDHNIVALEDVAFKAKSQGTDGFLLAKDRGGMTTMDNEEIIVVEDVAANLIHAKNIRMATALVHRPKTDDGHIDHHFDEVMDLCRSLKK